MCSLICSLMLMSTVFFLPSMDANQDNNLDSLPYIYGTYRDYSCIVVDVTLLLDMKLATNFPSKLYKILSTNEVVSVSCCGLSYDPCRSSCMLGSCIYRGNLLKS